MIRLIIGIFLLLILIETSLASAFMPKAFIGNFTQEKKDINSSKKRVSQIEIKYSYPTNIYFKEFSEVETHYVCNSKKVWKYNPAFIPGEKGVVSIGDSSKFCFAKVFDVLKPGLKSNKLYEVKELSSKEFELRFAEKVQNQINLQKLQLVFKSSEKIFTNLSKINIFYKESKTPVTLLPKKIKIKASIPASSFNFIIPENTSRQKMQ